VRVASIVGARPQFIKASPLLTALAPDHTSILIHTGQHYDDNMSDAFFRELALPAPDYDLGVGSDRHGAQTAKMLIAIEEALIAVKPDWCVVYGDTNSTLAGALVASKLCVKVAHVEAGLRSFNRAMPEEINRLVTDTLADVLFCPSAAAVANLAREGRTRGVHQVGDLMAEALREARERAIAESTILARLNIADQRFVLATVHRAENADHVERLQRIVRGLETSREPVIVPVHPRTRKTLTQVTFAPDTPVRLIDPVGYLDMVRLESAARLVLTDSGGVQKEAYWLGTPCATLREETEWVETVASGWNTLVGADPERIAGALSHFTPPAMRPDLYDGTSTARRIVDLLETA